MVWVAEGKAAGGLKNSPPRAMDAIHRKKYTV